MVFVAAGVLIVLSRRRAAPPPPLVATPPEQLPEAAKLVWVPTAPRRRRPDSYGMLSPGSLEDRSPRH
ncbi:MAG TPA: hypothetical protein VL463_15670 [Kofleriaceae bacterium]|nr:hypothetical protein [Kofleriaceae bacterium]